MYPYVCGKNDCLNLDFGLFIDISDQSTNPVFTAYFDYATVEQMSSDQ